jgi:hypothetical protein
MTMNSVHRVIETLVKAHLSSPWTWPRESDLVVDLVRRLRAELGPTICNEVRVELSDAAARHFAHVPTKVAPSAPRVRTEVRIMKPKADPTEEIATSLRETAKEKKKQKHLRRVDVAVMRPQDAAVVVHAAGARDVVLHVHEKDVEFALEVKLYSELYVPRGRCLWLEDIDKLSDLSRRMTCGLLLLDTALPLEDVGLTYKKGPRARRHFAEERGRLQFPWPLPAAGFDARSPAGRSLHFVPVDEPHGEGVYLWTLAQRQDSRWIPEYDEVTRQVPLLPAADMTPSCFAVTER